MEYNSFIDTAILAEQTIQNAAKLRDSTPWPAKQTGGLARLSSRTSGLSWTSTQLVCRC